MRPPLIPRTVAGLANEIRVRRILAGFLNPLPIDWRSRDAMSFYFDRIKSHLDSAFAACRSDDLSAFDDSMLKALFSVLLLSGTFNEDLDSLVESCLVGLSSRENSFEHFLERSR